MKVYYSSVQVNTPFSSCFKFSKKVSKTYIPICHRPVELINYEVFLLTNFPYASLYRIPQSQIINIALLTFIRNLNNKMSQVKIQFQIPFVREFSQLILKSSNNFLKKLIQQFPFFKWRMRISIFNPRHILSQQNHNNFLLAIFNNCYFPSAILQSPSMKKQPQIGSANTSQPARNDSLISLEQLRQKNKWNAKRGNIKTKDKLKIKILKYKQELNQLAKHTYIGMINHKKRCLNQGNSQRCQQNSTVKKTMEIRENRCCEKEQSQNNHNNGQHRENNEKETHLPRKKYKDLPLVNEENQKRSHTQPIGDLIESQRKYNTSFAHRAYRNFKTEQRKYKKPSQIEGSIEAHIITPFKPQISKTSHHKYNKSSDFETFSKQSTTKSQYRYATNRGERSYEMKNKQRSQYNQTQISYIQRSFNRQNYKIEKQSESDEIGNGWTGKIVKNRGYLVNKLGSNISKIGVPQDIQRNIKKSLSKMANIENYQSSNKKSVQKKKDKFPSLNRNFNEQSDHHIRIQYEESLDEEMPQGNPYKIVEEVYEQFIPQEVYASDNAFMSQFCNEDCQQLYETSKFGDDELIIQQSTLKQQLTRSLQLVNKKITEQTINIQPPVLPTQKLKLQPSQQSKMKAQAEQNRSQIQLQVEETHYQVVQTFQKLKQRDYTPII